MQFKNLELIKWIAVILMIGDHINKYLLSETQPFLYNAGRAAMPLFLFVLAYNLARVENLNKNLYSRLPQRLLIFGLISTPAYILLGGVIDGWWPLNIFFTLLSVTVTCYYIEKGKGWGRFYSLVIFIVSGALVEFCWPATAMGICAWLYFRKGSYIFLFMALIFCASLATVNHNFYALLAIPIIVMAGNIPLKLPRLKWFFYVFYPLHLYLILALRIHLTAQGYLFFT